MVRNRKLVLLLSATVLVSAGVAGVWYVRKQQSALERMRFSSELLSMALAYHNFAERHGFAPRELSDIEEESQSFSQVYQMIRKGDFVIRWNARLSGDGQENDKFILGYEAKAPSRGGWVLMGGLSRWQMSACEFRTYSLIPTE